MRTLDASHGGKPIIRALLLTATLLTLTEEDPLSTDHFKRGGPSLQEAQILKCIKNLYANPGLPLDQSVRVPHQPSLVTRTLAVYVCTDTFSSESDSVWIFLCIFLVTAFLKFSKNNGALEQAQTVLVQNPCIDRELPC